MKPKLYEGCPTWDIHKRQVSMPDRKLCLMVDQFIGEKELDEFILGPKVVTENSRSIIKVKCNRKTARMLAKCPGVIRLTTSNGVL